MQKSYLHKNDIEAPSRLASQEFSLNFNTMGILIILNKGLPRKILRF